MLKDVLVFKNAYSFLGNIFPALNELQLICIVTNQCDLINESIKKKVWKK